MARILPLPDQVIGRIAAGEAIARPSSVVKELVDNSLDAGATSIQVDVQGGGVRSIRVLDNGNGIAHADLELALQRHATSKLRTASDLERILTLGFRGEGLAAVAASARVTLVSRTQEDAHAWSIGADHGTVHPVKPAAGNVGTLVEVADLFGQIPARRKFLKAETTEWAHIEDVLRQAALAHPQVAFVWSHNERVRARYPVSDRERRMGAVMGESLVNAAARLYAEDPALGATVHGVLSVSGQGSPVLFVNDRPVRDKMVTHALHEAYQQALGRERSGTWCLFLNVDPASVDVNVHPTKAEVRFRDSSALHKFLTRAVGAVLREHFGEAPPGTAGGLNPETVTGASAPGAARTPGTPEAGVAPGAWYAPWLQPRMVAVPGSLPVAPSVDGRDGDGGQGAAMPSSGFSPALALVSTGAAEPRVVAVLHDRFVVIEHPEGMVVLDRRTVQQRAVRLALGEVLQTRGALSAQPLMVPVVVRAEAMDVPTLLDTHRDRLLRWGLDLSAQANGQALVRSMPAVPEHVAGRWDVAAAGAAMLARLQAQGEGLDDATVLRDLAAHSRPVEGLSLAMAQDLVRAVGTDGSGTVRWSWEELANAVGETGAAPEAATP